MSRAISSKKAPALPPPTIAKSCSKTRQSPRSPFQNLNRISSSSNSSDASSTVSAEHPRGCLRFLSSATYKAPVHRPKTISKTPSSVPNEPALKQSKSKSSKENLPKGNNAGLQTKKLVLDKARMNKKNPPLYQWQSGKKSGSRIGQNSKPLDLNGKFLPALPSKSEELKQKETEKEDILGGINDKAGERSRPKSCHTDASLTPLSKKNNGSDLDITVNGDVEENPDTSICRTPPIHNSVSPEIQCVSTTPACYGAGYIVSGVTDKRKCRPRGILTVEENCSEFAKMAIDSFDDDEKNITDATNEASPSSLPLPTEALVKWLSSPCKKEKKILMSENELNQSQGLGESSTFDSSTSPSSSSKTFWNVGDSSDLSGAANGIWRKMSSSISPSRLSNFHVAFDSTPSPSYPSILFYPNSTPCRAGSSEKGKSDQHNLIDENSPFSLNSVGSGNVIQTPQSDSSSDLTVGLSLVHSGNRKEDSSNPDLNSFSEVLQSEKLRLNSSMALEDSVNSSFQFDCLATVPYESIDLSKLQKLLDDQDPWLSSSTIETASQSHMRISWREGSLSQLDDCDEFDCCRCLSDEEDLGNDCGSNILPGTQTQANVEVDGGEKLKCDEVDGFGKEMFPALISCSGAESISTDGGGLVASRDDDSDWRLYGT